MQIADFGLAHAGRSGKTKFELVTTEVRGTPGVFTTCLAQRLIIMKRANKCTFPCSARLCGRFILRNCVGMLLKLKKICLAG